MTQQRAPHRAVAGSHRREQQRQAQAEARRQAQAETLRRKRRRWQAGGLGALLLGVVVALVVVFATGTTRPPSAPSRTTVLTLPFTPVTESGLSTAMPPWPLPGDSGLDIADAGLVAMGSESTAVHYHAHLDIIVNGAPVTVPAGVGFLIQGGQQTGITSLHTHDASGVVHIESPSDSLYTLGQLFTEWGISIGQDHIGGLADGNGNVLAVYVDGRRFSGNPADIVFKAHQEIAIWYGSATATPSVPALYSFPAGA